MEQLKEYYERQDTEELLAIARKDLTEEARLILQEVLAGRNVAPDATTAVRADVLYPQARDAEDAGRLATRWTRFLAFLVDVWGAIIVLTILLSPLRWISEEIHVNVVLAVWLVYFLLRDGIPELHLGKRLFSIRTVHARSSRSCTWLRSIWRNVMHLFFWVDALFILSSNKMRLGDMLAGTIVIKAEPEHRR